MNSYNECKLIAELDLDPIKVKLMHKESGEGWTLEQTSAVENEYRRFLYLAKMFPNEMVTPSENVDTFWHYHILDTMKYALDCEEVFGYFLHHFPYAGLRGEDDLAAHEQKGERMAVLYEKTFGEKYGSSETAAPEAKAAYCFIAIPPGSGGPTSVDTVTDTSGYFSASATKTKVGYCFVVAPGGGGISAPTDTAADQAGHFSSGGAKTRVAYCFVVAPGGGGTSTPTDTVADAAGHFSASTDKAKAAYCFVIAPTGGGISRNPARAIANDILMNTPFLTRPLIAA